MLAATMLGIIQYIVTVEVPDYVAMDDVLEQLATNNGEVYWPVICKCGFVSLAKKYKEPKSV